MKAIGHGVVRIQQSQDTFIIVEIKHHCQANGEWDLGNGPSPDCKHLTVITDQFFLII
jgi:hypothetical protein